MLSQALYYAPNFINSTYRLRKFINESVIFPHGIRAIVHFDSHQALTSEAEKNGETKAIKAQGKVSNGDPTMLITTHKLDGLYIDQINTFRFHIIL